MSSREVEVGFGAVGSICLGALWPPCQNCPTFAPPGGPGRAGCGSTGGPAALVGDAAGLTTDEEQQRA